MNKFSNLGHGQAQVPMNLFATWEVDRSSPHCVPRICSLALGKLVVLKELDKDVQSVFVAAKMQGSKRVLRSDAVYLANNGLLNTPLELTFSLQYHHFVKRGSNMLQLMLQRKKRYKNRSMLGYKTLAVSHIDMTQILQRPITEDTILELVSSNKDRRGSMMVVAQVLLSNLVSLPADTNNIRSRSGKGNDPSPDAENYSDENDETFSSDQEIGSDNQQEYMDNISGRKRKGRRSIGRMSSASSRQQNFIKAKVVALLKKFKQAEDEGLAADMVENPSNSCHDDLDFLYDEIEDLNLSDSFPENEDNISIVSTPKPKLKPFFDRMSHSSSQTEISSLHNAHEQDKFSHSMIPAIDMSDTSEPEEDVRPKQVPVFEHTHDNVMDKSSPGNKKLKLSLKRRKSSIVKSSSGQKMDATSSNEELEQMKPSLPNFAFPQTILGDLLTSTSSFEPPGSILIIDHSDRYSRCLLQAVQCKKSTLPGTIQHIISTNHQKDLSVIFSKIASQIQKFVSRNANQPFRIKIAVAGSDAYISLFLRQFVEFVSSKSLDWQNYLLFLFIPCGNHLLGRYLGSIDSRYNKLFCGPQWWDFFDKPAPSDSDISPMISRVTEYIEEAQVTVPLNVAEAMITLHQKNESDEDTAQKFIPFIMEVIVGEVDGGSTDSDTAESITTNITSSPAVNNTTGIQSPQTSITQQNTNSTPSSEMKMGLQVDYWKEKDFTKYTLKSNFRSLHVNRLPNQNDTMPNVGLSLGVVTVGKKNIMRLPGKKGKERDSDSKSQFIGSINRLICTSKHQHNLLKVTIDGMEWRDIKFFQLSSHWPSHAKTFPIGVFSTT